jgi:hypothetical protein
MILVWLGVAVLVGVWSVRRARRRRELAGLVADRPTFTVAPPTRRMGKRSREAL